MGKRIKLISMVLGVAVITSVGSQATPSPDTTNKISVTSRCIDQMKVYRQAIRFIGKRLAKSPSALTYVRENGEALTIHNRVHQNMLYERKVLEAGMKARARTCAKALTS